MRTIPLTFIVLGLALPLAAETRLADFSRSVPRWGATHSISTAAVTPDGLAFTVDANDPWLLGPRMDFPALPAGTKRVRFVLDLAPTDRATAWQLFYSFGGKSYNEGDSCRLMPVGGRPPYTRFVAEVPASQVKSGPCSFRIDPPDVGTNVSWTVKAFSCDFRRPVWTYAPETPPPLVIPAATPLVLKTRDWELRHDPDRLGAFRFHSRDKIVENNPEEPFVYLDRAGAVRTLDWSQAKMTARHTRTQLETRAELTDADGRTWRLTRWFSPQDHGRALTVSTQIARLPSPDGPLSAHRDGTPVLHVPFLTLFVDRASNGRKHQALLAGVEYLDDEPSSNDKEIRTVEHDRRIPAEYRLSAPLAVFTDEKAWLAAAWNQLSAGLSGPPRRPGPHPFAAVFDTPDRLFHSGGHLLAFWAPAVGPARRESELDVYEPTPFTHATHVVTLRTGDGATVAEALEGVLPSRESTLPMPDKTADAPSLELLARGWLDSEIRDGVLVRHAVPFTWGRPSDAPVLMKYLASELARRPDADATLAPRLRTAADEILAGIPRKDVGWHSVSHIHHPAPALVAGDVANWLVRKHGQQRDLNRRLADGRRTWTPQPGKPDFGETLGADHCNGFTSMELVALLRAATWSGDETEIAKTLAIVDKVTALYHGTVPRGAQPWEMPLHTPDIMASANLTCAYALAYLLKPDPAYLREARHWAYTGLSMVYLVPPPFEFGPDAVPVGRYATCAVMGATHWQQPNWIGRPVQWCGLVYAAALWELARIDPGDASAFWHRLAAGITASGVRQTHTAEDPAFIGLLPDSWDLEAQSRYAVPINPGTVQENLAECIGRPYYAVRRLAGGALVHVPGAAKSLSGTELRCEIEGWPEAPFQAVVTRLAKPASVAFAGTPAEHVYDAARRTLTVTLPARAKGELVIR